MPRLLHSSMLTIYSTEVAPLFLVITAFVISHFCKCDCICVYTHRHTIYSTNLTISWKLKEGEELVKRALQLKEWNKWLYA